MEIAASILINLLSYLFEGNRKAAIVSQTR